MKNTSKYTRQFHPVSAPKHKWASKSFVDAAPIWCSVDLRDGNQSLTIPMTLEEKLEFFAVLVKVGFKEIEVGFPAANETEFLFLRTLIQKGLIPDDVTIQVLTPSREHIIKRTFEALEGCKKAIVHLYNSTSVAQREQVFKKTKSEVIELATEGAKLIEKYAKESGCEYIFEYSPESFTATEPEFALDICNAVLDVWKPSKKRPIIINLPVTVELSSPHVYADQVEFMSDNLKYRENVIVSLHPHNDRGCAVADAELGLLAGAQRIEGTLFGNGERTGNVDIVTLALNMYSHGIDPKLDLSDLPSLSEFYESVTRMIIDDRHPYSGKLVFAAFSGSHQDAIAKGLGWREERGEEVWTVPYLPIDPRDVGREYETDVIRINSQSGKGGIGYLLQRNFGYVLPALMREDIGYTVKSVSDKEHTELTPNEVHEIFNATYVNVEAPIKLIDYHFTRKPEMNVELTLELDGKTRTVFSKGNGRLDAVSNALKENYGIKFSDLTYEEHALTKGSSSQAITYVSITLENARKVWGVGIHDDIIASSINALFSAVNRSF